MEINLGFAWLDSIDSVNEYSMLFQLYLLIEEIIIHNAHGSESFMKCLLILNVGAKLLTELTGRYLC